MGDDDDTEHFACLVGQRVVCGSFFGASKLPVGKTIRAVVSKRSGVPVARGILSEDTGLIWANCIAGAKADRWAGFEMAFFVFCFTLGRRNRVRILSRYRLLDDQTRYAGFDCGNDGGVMFRHRVSGKSHLGSADRSGDRYLPQIGLCRSGSSWLTGTRRTLLGAQAILRDEGIATTIRLQESPGSAVHVNTRSGIGTR